MVRSYDLQPHEVERAAQLQQENQNLLARYGAATLELDAVKEQLPKTQERQRDLISSAAARLGLREFRTARIDGQHLLCDLPDEIAEIDGPKPLVVPKPNGAPEKRAAKE